MFTFPFPKIQVLTKISSGQLHLGDATVAIEPRPQSGGEDLMGRGHSAMLADFITLN